MGAKMGWAADGPEKAAIHGVIGAIQASFGGGNVLAGGLAGMSSEVFGQMVNDYLSSHTQLDNNEKAAITQWAAAISGGAIGGVIGGSNGAQSGATVALDSVRYNYLDHKEAERKMQVENQLKNGDLAPEERQALQQELADINATDKARDQQILDVCTQGNKSSAGCGQLVVQAQKALNSYGGDVTYNLKYKDLFPADYANAEAIMKGLDDGSITRDAAITAIVNASGKDGNPKKSWDEVAETYDTVMQVHAIASALIGTKLAIDGATPGKAANNANKESATLNANDVRLSQNTVSFNKTERGMEQKYTYDDLVKSMRKDGWKGDPVDVVTMPDGKVTSMDNTRIAAAREAGINVQANVRNYNDKLTAAEMLRFSDPKRGLAPTTWGEAITGRINKQSGNFSKDNPYGANESPRITGKPKG